MIVAFVDVITCTLCFFIGTDCPTMRYLHKYVIPHIYAQWYDIGIQLLDVEDESMLKVIIANNPDIPEKCTTELLNLWLTRRENASWNELIHVLRQPHIGLSVLASKIKNMLVKEEDISFKGMITIM